MYCAGKKKKSRKVDGKQKPGCGIDEKKKKKKKKKSEKRLASRKLLSATSDKADDHHSLEDKFDAVLGEVVQTNQLQSGDELQTGGGKSKITSDEKVKEKKKKKRIKKKGSDLGEKENMAKEVSEGSESSLPEPFAGKKDGVEPDKEKKKKRKRKEINMEEKHKPKKIKKSNDPVQKKMKSSQASVEMTEDQSDFGLMESVFASHSSPEVGSGKVKHRGKEGNSKPGISKPKKPKFGASAVISSKFDTTECRSQASNSVIFMSPNLAARKGLSKPKFGASPVISAKCDSAEPNSQSSNSNSVTSMSPDFAPRKDPSKPKKPKFGVTAPYPNTFDAQDTYRGKEGSSKHKKPMFGARTPKSSQELSELAQELGEMMKETEKEAATAEEIQIPVIKLKKIVPVFGKK